MEAVTGVTKGNQKGCEIQNNEGREWGRRRRPPPAGKVRVAPSALWELTAELSRKGERGLGKQSTAAGDGGEGSESGRRNKSRSPEG